MTYDELPIETPSPLIYCGVAGKVRDMKIAVAQNHNTPDRESNRRRVTELVESASGQRADLVLFPEMSLLEFFPRVPHRYEYLELAEPARR